MPTENNVIFQLPLSDLINAISNDILVKLIPLFPVTPSLDISKKTQKYLTRKEVANLIGVSLPTLHKYSITGKIPAYRIARQVRYKENEVMAALALIKTI